MPAHLALVLGTCVSISALVCFVLLWLKVLWNNGASANRQGETSSSSSQTEITPVNPPKKFHVFINHRGPDTKQSVAYHIYDMLKDRGVAVFLDVEELDPGGQFPQDIAEAIESCTVHICVLSPSYAQSAWCLKELAMIMNKCQCHKEKQKEKDKEKENPTPKCLIIPIFFEVLPSDVRYLKGDFGQGFRNFCWRRKKRAIRDLIKALLRGYVSEGFRILSKHQSQVDLWKQALLKLSDCNGFPDKGKERKTIVRRVCEFLDSELTVIPSGIVGRQEQLLSVKDDILRRRNWCMAVTVEITGMGGIGKTTFAELLFNSIRAQFDRHCFIEDVNGKVEKGGILAVQQQLFKNLLRYDPSVDCGERQTKQLLQNRLHDEEILIVLDNVNREISLSDMFMDQNFFPQASSTIIITSREPVIEKDPELSKYSQNLISFEINKLGFEESKKIFCNNAFKDVQSIDDKFDNLVKKIVEKCDGVPLALTLFGKHVYGEDHKFWKNFWEFWQDSVPKDIKGALRISYDRLEPLEKCLFLDVATFFYDEKENLLRSVREDDHNDSRFSVSLRTLENKRLIKIKDGCLQMHDLLRDLGRAIVDDEADYTSLGLRSRLWRPQEVKRLLSDEMGTGNVKGINLVSKGMSVLNEYDDDGKWPAEAFETMSSLEILILHGDCIRGDYSKLPKRLLWLKWTDCPLESIPSTLSLKRLRVLELSGNKQRVLWVNDSSQEPPVNLRQLILSDCINIQRIPEFTKKYKHLRTVHISGCLFLQIIPDSFGELQGLEYFKVENCRALELLPTTMGNLKNLVEFHLDRTRKLKFLPKSFGQLTKIKKIRLHWCNCLEVTEDSFGDIKTLQYIMIHGCRVPRLPKQLTRQPDLENLVVEYRKPGQIVPEGCVDLLSNGCIDLPRSRSLSEPWNEEPSEYDFGEMPKLHTLILESSELTKFPHSIENLSGLKELEVLGALNLQELPESFGNLSNLRKLTLSTCLALRELPQSLGNLTNLRDLKLFACQTLYHLPASTGQLLHLDNLWIEACRELQHLPDAIGCLQNLTRLEIQNCPNLRGFPPSFGNIASLERVTVINCWMLEAIDVTAMFNLRVLALDGCMNLKSIGPRWRNLPPLLLLHTTGCLNLKEIPNSVSCSSLTQLYLQGCWQLALPETLWLQSDNLRCIELSMNDKFLAQPDMNFKLQKRIASVEDISWFPHLKLSAKASPMFLRGLKREIKKVLPGKVRPAQELTEWGRNTLLISCFIAAIRIDDFPQDIPLPGTEFSIHFPQKVPFMQHNCGEEIHFFIKYDNSSAKKRALNFSAKKSLYYPGYEALVKDGWLICLQAGEKQKEMLSSIVGIVYSELRRQRLLSLAWSRLPSSLDLFAVSALDLANCRITRLYRHHNISIMEEDMGLTLKRKRCLFEDDHALLVSSSHKHSFGSINLSAYDLKEVANIYEMIVRIFKKGEVGYTRTLQEASLHNNNIKDIPAPLCNVFSESKTFKPHVLARGVLGSQTMQRLEKEWLRLNKDSAKYFTRGKTSTSNRRSSNKVHICQYAATGWKKVTCPVTIDG